jgi:hypothetical protein
VKLDLEEIEVLYEKLAQTSSFADVWLQLLLTCNGYDIHAGVHPPKSSANNRVRDGSQINTSYPILFLSNTLDPVTPLVAGVKMALKFKDAGLVEQQSAGHCTLSSYSPCTFQVVRNYILDGIVPPPPVVQGDDYLGGEWKTCEVPYKSAGIQQFPDPGWNFDLRINDKDSDLVKEQKLFQQYDIIRDAVMQTHLWGRKVMVNHRPYSGDVGVFVTGHPAWM